MNKWVINGLLFVSCMLICGCGPTGTKGDETPGWVKEVIQKLQDAPVANPPASIWKYDYKGQVVYYIPPRAGDIPSTLLDADGKVICHPDGGLTGAGDGRCPDFFDERENELLIWEDQR